MSTQFYDLDINAKLPIIRVDSSSSQHDLSMVNGTSGDNQLNNQSHNQQQPHQQQPPNGLNVKKPSFRYIDDNKYMKKNHTVRKARDCTNKDSYFHYEEPSAKQLLERVEYDMDEEDIEWLNIFNNKHVSKYSYRVSEADFEKIMDRLEKVSYFVPKNALAERPQEVDEEALCAICNDGTSDQNVNAIIFCDMCDLAVHQECYGVPYVPEGSWLCRRCLQSPSQNVSCVLCPNLGGAFKQTDNNKWAHVICALWIPEVCFANTVFLEPIDSIEQIPPARWKLNCYICKQKRQGACIQCHKTNCYLPFHVTCAQQAGLYMKIKNFKYNTPDGPLTDVKKEAFCDLHDPTDGKGGAGGMYEGDETDEEDVNSYAYRKWKQKKKDKMKKTRAILADRREQAFNPIAEPNVPPEKLEEIANLLVIKGKRKSEREMSELRQLVIRHMKGYWLQKRQKRNGVPLLRRLQVSLNNNIANGPQIQLSNEESMEKWKSLRFDLEKGRLLIGEVKKREVLKRRMLHMTKSIIEARFNLVDIDDPPTEE